jgi:hypothetical protein
VEAFQEARTLPSGFRPEPPWSAFPDAWQAASEAATSARRLVLLADEHTLQTQLLRDVFATVGAEVAPSVDPQWLAWDGVVVAGLAQSAYDRWHQPSGLLDNNRLAVLADALEEAGCSDAILLDHLRSGREHVRGCFVVDFLLGKS